MQVRLMIWVCVVVAAQAARIALAAPAAAQHPIEPPPKPPAQPPPAAASITPDSLYVGVDRPAMITVAAPGAFSSVTLALMDHDGAQLAPPVTIIPGRHDLADLFPGIFKLQRAAFVQALINSQPEGSALVVQPMLSRLVPVTQPKPHPVTGKMHTRIVGWKDENEPAPPEAPEAAQPPEAPEAPPEAAKAPPQAPHASTTPPAARAASTSAAPAAPAPPVERLCTGLRLYAEHDVILRTTCGDMRFAMRPDEAPNTVWNFLELARGGFYRDVQFHRVKKLDAQGRPFVIQAGDPTGTGDGGPGWWLPIEPSALQHTFGVISMARADDPDSAGSQFFIALSREGTARLDGQYCAFGYAVDGAQAIIAIANVEIGDVATDRPVNPPVIRSAELVSAPPRAPGKGRPDRRVSPDTRPAEPRPTRVPR